MSTPMAFDIKGAAEESAVSTSTIERAINSGRLRVKRTSIDENGDPAGKRIILAADLQAWLEGLPDG